LNQEQLTLLSAERPASRSQSQDSEREWMTLVATWRSSFLRLLTDYAPSGFAGRTSLEYCQAQADGTLVPSSGRWGNSGTGGPTESLTHSISEFPNGGAVCSLSDILEDGNIPQRFFLSEKACRGILRRAEKRGKALPEHLKAALVSAAIPIQATAMEAV